ncbi:MAG: hypothetical protein J5I98_05965 [Phaeodactylibacter sp.]|nr:hypothetical protein [Phaeodactylibacter sp.]
MEYQGQVIHLGSQVNTDLLFPSEAILLMDNIQKGSQAYNHILLEYGFKNLDIKKRELKKSQIVVGGAGMGAGSSRQFAVEVLKLHNIVGIVADSIHPIFYRNAWNLGLFAVEVPKISERICTGDVLKVDLAKGALSKLTSPGFEEKFPPIPPWLADMLKCGGLVNYLLESKK